MNPKIAIPALVTIAAASAASASAQETSTPYFQQYVAPPRNALELTVGTGYTQGFGSLYRGLGIPSVAREGIAVDFGLGYRIDPHWMIVITGEYQELDAQRAASVRGVTAGAQAAYHFSPSNRVDPWAALGTGYRWLWEHNDAPGSTVTTQGLQIGRLTLGVDVRMTPQFAIAPVIGADLDVFLAQNSAAVTDARTSTFVYAGLLGRFDLFAHPEQVAHRAPAAVGVVEIQPAEVAQVVSPTVAVSPSISVSPDIARDCRLKLDDSPEFAFDDSTLTDVDRRALDAIAACLTTGPLQGDPIRLIGRADPRGGVEYNMALGSRRAKGAADYLNEQGMQPANIEQTSRGAKDAKGDDEATWASDRRVDVLLVK